MKNSVKRNVKRFEALLRRLLQTISNPEMQILPGQLAYHFVLMLVPLMGLFASALTLFNLSSDYISSVMLEHLPSTVTDLLVSISSGTNMGTTSIFLLVPLIYIASNGMDSVITASNLIYKLENEKFFKRRVKAIFMLFVLIILFIFIILVPVFGNMLFKIIGNLITGKDVSGYSMFVFNLLKYPLSFLTIYFAVKVLYVIAPNAKVESKNVSYGAIFTTCLWIGGSEIFTLYVENFSSYSTVYGGIAGIIVLMLWIYFLAYVFTLGMALNVSKYQMKKDV